jgi:adenylyl-sulfate kinase
MSELAALLELLHGAHDRVATLEAEFCDWSAPRPSHELIVERSEHGGVRPRWRGPWPRASASTRRMWLEGRDRLRVEVVRNRGVVRLGVRDNTQWWRWDRADGASIGKISAIGQGPIIVPPLLWPPLLEPVGLLASLRFEPAGVAVCAGRETACARAWPRDEIRFRAGLSYELQFDAQHGTMLRRAAFEHGTCVQVTEATRVRYDCPIDPERFVFVSPDGRPAREIEASTEALREPDGRPVLPAPRGVVGNGQYAPASVRAHPAGTLWLTGLAAAGKTTLALAVEAELTRHDRAALVVDGDALRHGLSDDLGLSRADRAEQARRAAHVAALACQAGVVAIVALISPYAEDRLLARRIHDERGLRFFEVWVDTPLAMCAQRDPKGLYARARAGEIEGLTGVDAPYESPEAPDLRVPGFDSQPAETARRVAELLIAARREVGAPSVAKGLRVTTMEFGIREAEA